MYGLYLDCENSLSRHICEKLYLNSSMTDVKFVLAAELGGFDVVSSHKFILASGSVVFNDMFYGPLSIDNNEIQIDDVSADAFKEFLQFFYLDEVRLTTKNIVNVTNLCEKFQLIDCLKSCATSLRYSLTTDDICWGYALALSLKDKNLIHFCEQKIQENVPEVIDSDSFLQCDHAIMEKLLALFSLSCSPYEIVTACMKWAKAKCAQNGVLRTPKNLRNSLNYLFNQIPFEELTLEQFSKFLILYKNIFNGIEMKKIVKKIAVNNLKRICLAKAEMSLNEGKKSKNNALNMFSPSEQVLDVDRQTYGESIAMHSAGDIFTAFSINRKIILKEFYAKLHGPAKFDHEIPYDINSKSMNSPMNLISGRATILKGSDQLHVILAEPLIIDANKLYFINIYNFSTDCIDFSSGVYDQPILRSKIRLANVEVTFKTNVHFDCDSITRLVFEK